MGSFSILHWIIVLIIIAAILPPYWKLTTRSGRPGALALLILVPLVNFFYLWWLAFSRWPSDK